MGSVNHISTDGFMPIHTDENYIEVLTFVAMH